MITCIISKIWIKLINDIIGNPEKFSSEKSIVFHFAWSLKEIYKHRINFLDFEKQLYERFSDGSYLDLYFEVDEMKVGIEFKFPKKSINGYTNQTQTRIKVINDIKRLTYLVEKTKLDFGVFLMATNERPYIFDGNKTIFPEFKTYENAYYAQGKYFPIHDVSSKEKVICAKDISFKWNGINNGLINKIAWIEPIVIHA